MEWNVFYENFNGRKIESYNIFRHYSFYEDCKKAAKKYKDDRESFEKHIKSSLMYYYWSKCEWEIVLSSWPSGDRTPDRKIDVYDQVMLNWKPFIDYVWAHAAELRRREKKVKIDE